jgi:hypothetical protein
LVKQSITCVLGGVLPISPGLINKRLPRYFKKTWAYI